MKRLFVLVLCLGMLFTCAAVAENVISADEWAETYPAVVESYKANSENSYRVSYIEEDPYIVELYEGFGFAKDYTSAIGHTYTLADVAETQRPHALANCLTCKTPDFTKLVNDMGVEAYAKPFDEVYAQMKESVSCYNCHGNEAGDNGKLVVTHSYVTDALGADVQGIALDIATCGQCHIEYYFDPATKATSMPYDSVAAMAPDAILAKYNEMGFADWTQPSTGTAMLKAQHPEMETYLGEGSVHKNMGMSCADCHMEKVTGETNYISHEWVSPLKSEAIMTSCAACHRDTDVAALVKGIQDGVTARETEVGESLAGLKGKLAAAVADGSKTEDELNAIRALYRDAQWYWDFCYVENAEGAHNSKLANFCLDKSEELIAEALKLF